MVWLILVCNKNYFINVNLFRHFVTKILKYDLNPQLKLQIDLIFYSFVVSFKKYLNIVKIYFETQGSSGNKFCNFSYFSAYFFFLILK